MRKELLMVLLGSAITLVLFGIGFVASKLKVNVEWEGVAANERTLVELTIDSLRKDSTSKYQYSAMIDSLKKDSISKYEIQKSKELAQKREVNLPVPPPAPEYKEVQPIREKEIEIPEYQHRNHNEPMPSNDLYIEKITDRNPLFGSRYFDICLNNISYVHTYQNPILRVKWYQNDKFIKTVDYRMNGTFSPNSSKCNIIVKFYALGGRYEYEII